jgi:hypothetical protein
MSQDQLFEQRIPGRIVVVALGFLYVWGISGLFGFARLASFSFLAVLVLLVIAIVWQLGNGAETVTSQPPDESATTENNSVGSAPNKSLERTREE